MDSKGSQLHVGLCGAGLGGLAAAISIARASTEVAVLEAAAELGEIEAGIQMTPNSSRLLIRWGISDIIGDNLCTWWVVHRHDLHQGPSEGARRHSVNIVIDARVTDIDNEGDGPMKISEDRYAIVYLISAGKDLNLVPSHHRVSKVEDVEEVKVEELHSFYKVWDSSLVKVVNMTEASKR
ncbi:uncharacterized protein PAC_07775 [Phialocephala subalpina]|uniref:FAD-binding domain-containing protein n=1 Tax=Phialocephala subalpina TaxID=576137 RepID=A0A1L7WYP6_9HELO|nr:uncharacterized protein PAC_07775 [Phialocephala subalpina]